MLSIAVNTSHVILHFRIFLDANNDNLSLHQSVQLQCVFADSLTIKHNDDITS